MAICLQEKWPWWSRGAAGSAGCLTKQQPCGCPLKAHTLLLALQQTFCCSVERLPTCEIGLRALPCSQGCCEGVGVVYWVAYAVGGAIFGDDIKLFCMCGWCQYKYNYFESQRFHWFRFIPALHDTQNRPSAPRQLLVPLGRPLHQSCLFLLLAGAQGFSTVAEEQCETAVLVTFEPRETVEGSCNATCFSSRSQEQR